MSKNMSEKVMAEIKPYVQSVTKLAYEGSEEDIQKKIVELHDGMYGGSIDSMCEFFALTIVSRIVQDEKTKGDK